MRRVASLLALAALGATTFAGLRPTNFRGYDEWLILWMLSRGIVSFPYANRPLGLVWHTPAWLVAPERLWGFVLIHAFWLTVIGLLVFLILRRLLPDRRELAFLAGAIAIAWMPSDQTRVVTVQMIPYSGAAAGVLLATWLLIEAGHRHSRVLLLAAAVAATVSALSHEATVAPLVLASPLLLLGCPRDERRRCLPWAAAWLVLVGVLALRAVLPALTAREALAYQLADENSLRGLAGVLRQTRLQLQYHLGPLVAWRPAELAAPVVWLAAAVFVVGFAVARGGRGESSATTRRPVAIAGALGLAHALLAYLPFMLARGVRGPVRTEFLSAAGVATLIASAVVLAGSLVPGRLRPWLVAALGAWVVAQGTGRTVAMQRAWDGRLYAHQRGTLDAIARAAPGLQPHTLVVLVQSGHTWGFSFSFSKAIEWLYDDAARGWVVEADPFLAATRVEGAVVLSEPAPATRGPWRQAVERYRPDEVVAFGEDEAGYITLLASWPERAGPQPPGTTYAPRERIRSEGPARARVEGLPRR